MKLKVQFGLTDSREVFWYQPLEDFPHLVNYLGNNYEWVMYDNDPKGLFDQILIFSEVSFYSNNYKKSCPVWKDMFKDEWDACQCGARFSSFKWDHMRYCPKWTKW